jgi:hypothetical protein
MSRILFNHVVKQYGKDRLPVVKDFNLEIRVWQKTAGQGVKLGLLFGVSPAWALSTL